MSDNPVYYGSTPGGGVNLTVSNITVDNIYSAATGNSALANSTLRINPGATLCCQGRKGQPLSASTTTTVAQYSGSAGILRRVWLAIIGPGAQTCSLLIYIDGVLVVGNLASSADGLNQIQLFCDVLFAAGDGANGNPFQVDHFGYNLLTSTIFGGYFAMDMPFQSSYQVVLNNTSGTAGNYWSQIFYNNNASIPQSLAAIKLHITTFRYTGASYYNEYPLLYTDGSVNGVYLKGVKMICNANSGQWWEGRFRMYTGGTTGGSTSPQIPATGYTDATTNVSLNYANGAVNFFTSTGFEDFFQSSDNFSGTTYSMSNNVSGILWNSAGNGSGVSTTTAVSVYRFFGDDAGDLPSSPANEPFIFTWTVSDTLAGSPSGNVFLVGQVYYYA